VKCLRTVVRVEDFRALLVSYAINRAGDVVGSFALAVVVLRATGSGLATAGLFLCTQFVPGLIGPLLVAHVDRVAVGRLLPVVYVVEACFFGLLAAIVGHVGIAQIFMLGFADAALAFVARSVTRAAAASVLIPHDLMPEGKAAFNVALAAATVAGPVLGGVAVETLGAPAALIVDAASFLFAAALVARARGLRVREPADAAAAAAPWSRLRESISYVAGNEALRMLLVGEGLAFVFFYLVVPVTVVYASRSLHAGSAGYAAILAAWGVGIAIGSAAHLRLGRRIGTGLVFVSTSAVAIGYLGTAAAPTLAVACAASVLGGIGNGTQWASVETAVHELVEDRFRARVAAVLEALAAIAPGVGIALGGALTAALSPRLAYLVAGLGLFVLVGVGIRRRGSLSRRARDPGLAWPDDDRDRARPCSAIFPPT
jgi:DHA3 family macrolide efflux protein-like MFS transporter